MQVIDKWSDGSFYTPTNLAKKIHDDSAKIIPNYPNGMFWDPASGQGDLLCTSDELNVPNEYKIATTLHVQDVWVVREKGIKAEQLNFINDSYYNTPKSIMTLIYSMLLEGHTEELLRNTSLNIICNPPFSRKKEHTNTIIRDEFYGKRGWKGDCLANTSLQFMIQITRITKYILKNKLFKSVNLILLNPLQTFTHAKDLVELKDYVFDVFGPIDDIVSVPSKLFGKELGIFPMDISKWSTQLELTKKDLKIRIQDKKDINKTILIDEYNFYNDKIPATLGNIKRNYKEYDLRKMRDSDFDNIATISTNVNNDSYRKIQEKLSDKPFAEFFLNSNITANCTSYFANIGEYTKTKKPIFVTEKNWMYYTRELGMKKVAEEIFKKLRGTSNTIPNMNSEWEYEFDLLNTLATLLNPCNRYGSHFITNKFDNNELFWLSFYDMIKLKYNNLSKFEFVDETNDIGTTKFPILYKWIQNNESNFPNVTKQLLHVTNNILYETASERREKNIIIKYKKDKETTTNYKLHRWDAGFCQLNAALLIGNQSRTVKMLKKEHVNLRSEIYMKLYEMMKSVDCIHF